MFGPTGARSAARRPGRKRTSAMPRSEKSRANWSSLGRCRAYAAADDLYWGLRALAMDRASPRHGLEFRKYANWRLLRCRMRVGRPDFEETLRTL